MPILKKLVKEAYPLRAAGESFSATTKDFKKDVFQTATGQLAEAKKTTLKQNNWYDELRFAELLIEANNLVAFERFLKENPKRLHAGFVIGMLRLLREVIFQHENLDVRAGALHLLAQCFLGAKSFQEPSITAKAKDALVNLSRHTVLGRVLKENTFWGHHQYLQIEVLRLFGEIAIHSSNPLHIDAQTLLIRIQKTDDETQQHLLRQEIPAMELLVPQAEPLALASTQLMDAALKRPQKHLESKLDSIDKKIDEKLDAGERVKALIQQHRQRVLADEEITKELTLYIASRGKHRSEDEKTFDLEQEVTNFLKADARVLLLLGSSGAGKTLFARYLEREYCKAYKPDHPIPLYIPLTSIDNPNKNLIEQVLQQKGFSPAQILHAKMNYRFIFFIDGFDEVRGKENLIVTNHLTEWQAKIVVGCRTEYLLQRQRDYRTLFVPYSHERPMFTAFRECTVAPFTQAQITAYLEKYVAAYRSPWPASRYKIYLNKFPNLQTLVESPYMLFIMASALPEIVARYSDANTEAFAKLTRAALYDTFMEQWFERQIGKLAKQSRLELLGRNPLAALSSYTQSLAVAMWKAGISVVEYKPSEAVTPTPLTSYLNPLNVVQTVKTVGHTLQWLAGYQPTWDVFFKDDPRTLTLRLACPIVKEGEHRYRFIHDSLREYLACKDQFNEVSSRLKLVSPLRLAQAALAQKTQPGVVIHESKEMVGQYEVVTIVVDEIKAKTTSCKAEIKATAADAQDKVKEIHSQPEERSIVTPAKVKTVVTQTERRPEATAIVSQPEAKATVMLSDGDVKAAVPPPEKEGSVAQGEPKATVVPREREVKASVSKLKENAIVPQAEKKKIISTESAPSFEPAPPLVRQPLYVGGFNLNAKLLNDSPSLIRFHADLVNDHPRYAQILWDLLERSKQDPDIAIAAANAITILSAAQVSFNQHKDLRQVRIAGAICGWVYDNVDFSEADLRQVNFAGAWLRGAKFDRAMMQGIQFGELPSLLLKNVAEACAYSADGQWFATTEGKDIAIYDTSTWDRVRELKGHMDRVTCLAFDPHDRNRLASGSNDHTVRLWDMVGDNTYQVFKGHISIVTCLAFDLNIRNRLASGSYDNTIRVWKVGNDHTSQILTGHTDIVNCLAFDPRIPNRLASGGYDNTIRVWDIAGGNTHQVLRGPSAVLCLTFDPHAPDRIVSGTKDNAVCVWDMHKAYFSQKLTGHTDRVTCLAIDSHVPGSLASGSNDHTVRMWDMTSGHALQILMGHTDKVRCLSFDHSIQGRLASGSEDRTVRLWIVDSGKIYRSLTRHVPWPVCLSFDPHTTDRLVSGSNDEKVRVWELGQGRNCQTFTGYMDKERYEYNNSWTLEYSYFHSPHEKVRCLAFDPNTPNRVASGNYDDICIWDVGSGNTWRTLQGHTDRWGHPARVWCLAFDPRVSNYLASGSDYNVWVWDVNRGNVRQILKGHTDEVWCLAFDHMIPNRLASGSRDCTVRGWDIVSGRTLWILKGHTDDVSCVAFDPHKSNRLASGSSDVTVRIWDVGSGCILLQTLRKHTDWVMSLAFDPLTPDRLASGSLDQTVRVWDLKSGKSIIVAKFPKAVYAIAWSKVVFIVAAGVNLYCFDVIRTKNTLNFELRWLSGPPTLWLDGASIQGAQGLEPLNYKLLTQRGATGIPTEAKEESKAVITQKDTVTVPTSASRDLPIPRGTASHAARLGLLAAPSDHASHALVSDDAHDAKKDLKQ